MDKKDIQEEISQVKEHLDSDDETTLLNVEDHPFKGFAFADMTLLEFVKKGRGLGVNEFYLTEDRTDDGDIELGGICFFHNGRAHTLSRATTKLEEQLETSRRERGPQASKLEREESEEEKQRKQEIAEELLTQREDYLNEDEKFELENRLDRMRLRRLLRLQDRVEKEASVDPEEEKRLARLVYEDDRFHRQFNSTDTEMLLDELNVEYNSDNVRIDEVHKQAKSLLKINK